ncbi:DUF6379 domain-containing protein [Demequina sp. SYSU T00192]|uniref:C-deglycosylation enzyme beta subunit n=1 Tax=Demequina litoralis TaxID=3051660 RepID=A0ABT8GAB4_9MICO|nr:DUF6379 domain-containing protein [Demequina sp. SYSU T00192]MDN4476083.1 DUF6379 domain-containing protein [Demequina sp. SYSU T00192]
MPSITQFCMREPFEARVADDTLAFQVFEPWYRSLPVSCLAGLDVTLDGEPVAADAVTVEIDGVERTLAECDAAVDDVWFIQDPATVRVKGATPADQVRIGVHMNSRIPYIMVGPEVALPKHTVQEELFTVVNA